MNQLPASVPSINPPLYPRVYKVHTGWAAFILRLVAGASGVVGFLVWYTGGFDLVGVRFLGILAINGVLVGGLAIVDTRRSGVTLYADAIRVARASEARRLRRDQIKGYQVVDGLDRRPAIVLVPEVKNQRKLKVPPVIGMDEAFRRWIETLPALDAAAAGKLGATAAADHAATNTTGRTGKPLTYARKLAWGLNLVAVITAATFAYAGPVADRYGALATILAALPCLAIWLVTRSHGTFLIIRQPHDSHPRLDLMFIAPAIALAMRGYLDFPMLNWIPALVAALVGSAALAGIAIRTNRNWLCRPRALVLLPVLAVYAYGCTVLANGLLDHSPPEVFAATVVSKNAHMVGSGRRNRGPPIWYLSLAPWGPQLEASDVSVSPSIYDAAAVGRMVCVELRPGVLSIPWYGVTACRCGPCAP